MSAGSTEKDKDNDSSNALPWARATPMDLLELDFEAPIAGSQTADPQELHDLFRAAVQPGDGSTEPAELAATRVFTMLAGITSMHLNSNERNEPFRPMMILADGHRSAGLSDFRAHVGILADLAERATNPVLRARLADVCWVLDRKRGDLASAAVSAYVDIVQKTDDGALKYRFATGVGALQYEACDLLRRALQIGRAIGRDKPETIATRELVTKLRKRAVEKRTLVPILWFCNLDWDFSVSEGAELGASLDEVLADPPANADLHLMVSLWRLAARAYQSAKRGDDKNRCLSQAAECLAAEAMAMQTSAIQASHFLSSAIAQLHGVPGKKGRRTELRHKLVDIQARVPEELSVFSQKFDLRGTARKAQEAVEGVSLPDKLFVFANLAASPDPEELARVAAEAISKHPISSLFGTSHLDREGKVIFRSPGGSLGDSADSPSIPHQIARSESVRRNLVVSGKIDAARQTIVNQHYLSDDLFVSLLQYSPFVPPDVVGTFAQGFTRYFQGDFVSAIYILTPLLETSLRHVLKTNGHDVSIFDDATQTQEDRTLSALFEQMRTELDAVFGRAITTDIENVFLTKPGPHLRHAVAHGMLHDGDPYGADAIYGCWLIFRLCLMPVFQYYGKLHFEWDN